MGQPRLRNRVRQGLPKDASDCRSHLLRNAARREVRQPFTRESCNLCPMTPPARIMSNVEHRLHLRHQECRRSRCAAAPGCGLPRRLGWLKECLRGRHGLREPATRRSRRDHKAEALHNDTHRGAAAASRLTSKKRATCHMRRPACTRRTPLFRSGCRSARMPLLRDMWGVFRPWVKGCKCAQLPTPDPPERRPRCRHFITPPPSRPCSYAATSYPSDQAGLPPCKRSSPFSSVNAVMQEAAMKSCMGERQGARIEPPHPGGRAARTRCMSRAATSATPAKLRGAGAEGPHRTRKRTHASPIASSEAQSATSGIKLAVQRHLTVPGEAQSQPEARARTPSQRRATLASWPLCELSDPPFTHT